MRLFPLSPGRMNTPTPEDSKIAALRSANSLDEPYTREIASSVTKETFANDPLSRSRDCREV